MPASRTLAGLLGLWLLLWAGACSHGEAHGAPAGEHLRGRLQVTGSSTVAPLVLEMAKAFEALHPGVRVDVQSGGSSRGIADAAKGLADIGMASRALKAGEQDRLRAHTLARDGIGLIVHADNDLDALESEQVRAIFRGKHRSWAALGQRDLPLNVIHKAAGRATQEVFLQHFGLAQDEVRPSVVVGENEHAIKTVAGDPGAIGYVSIGAAEQAVRDGVRIRLLALDGIAASTDNLARGRFPLARPLILVTQPTGSPLVRAFLEYCQSPAVHGLIQGLSFIPAQPVR